MQFRDAYGKGLILWHSICIRYAVDMQMMQFIDVAKLEVVPQ